MGLFPYKHYERLSMFRIREAGELQIIKSPNIQITEERESLNSTALILRTSIYYTFGHSQQVSSQRASRVWYTYSHEA